MHKNILIIFYYETIETIQHESQKANAFQLIKDIIYQEVNGEASLLINYTLATYTPFNQLYIKLDTPRIDREFRSNL